MQWKYNYFRPTSSFLYTAFRLDAPQLAHEGVIWSVISDTDIIDGLVQDYSTSIANALEIL